MKPVKSKLIKDTKDVPVEKINEGGMGRDVCNRSFTSKQLNKSRSYRSLLQAHLAVE
jgi:hypothetical protein